MGGTIFQKERVKVPVITNKVKITISAKEVMQKMTLKKKPITSK
jgi:hypothetical protein